MITNIPNVVEYGCDWLTLTATDDEYKKTQLELLWDSSLVYSSARGHTTKKEKRLGYDGASIGGVFLGKGKQGLMLQASGYDAGRVLRSLDEWQEVPHVTRIDWQVTVDMGNDLVNYAEVAAIESEVARARLPKALQWKLTHYRGFGKGDSLYVGARTSQVCCRIYDKAAESPDQYTTGHWRYEIEYKGKVAQASLANYIQSTEKLDYAVDIVAGELDKRGVIVPFYEHTAPRTIAARRPQTSNEKRLQWLRSAVKPAINELRKAGLLADARIALDL